MRRLLIIILLLLSFPITSIFAQNTPTTDYQYQLDQYRRHYAEFKLFQKDYLNNNTLDNEQKAVLAAQSTLSARELTMASFVQILKQSIIDSRINLPLTISTINSLDSLSLSYQQQADAVKLIQTKKDLANFSQSYQPKLKTNQLILDTAQVVNKLAQLMRMEADIEEQSALLILKLENKRQLVLVQSGLDEVTDFQNKVNTDFDAIIKQVAQMQANDYYRQDSINQISQNLVLLQDKERRLVERLIDLDTNYVAF